MCNFFGAHNWNYNQTATNLGNLTRKKHHWKGGPLPEEALQAF